MKKDDLHEFVVDIMLIDATCGDAARAVAVELGIPCTIEGEGPRLSCIAHHYESAYQAMEWVCQVSNGTWDMAGNRLIFRCPRPEDDTFNLAALMTMRGASAEELKHLKAGIMRLAQETEERKK